MCAFPLKMQLWARVKFVNLIIYAHSLMLIGLWIQFFTCYYEKYWYLKISKYKMHVILKKALIGYQLLMLLILIVL